MLGTDRHGLLRCTDSCRQGIIMSSHHAKLIRLIDHFDHDGALSVIIQLATQYKLEMRS